MASMSLAAIKGNLVHKTDNSLSDAYFYRPFDLTNSLIFKGLENENFKMSNL